MNVLVPRNDRNDRNVPPPVVARPAARVRDFGVGYGRSSGYVSQPRYASSAFASRFRLA